MPHTLDLLSAWILSSFITFLTTEKPDIISQHKASSHSHINLHLIPVGSKVTLEKYCISNVTYSYITTFPRRGCLRISCLVFLWAAILKKNSIKTWYHLKKYHLSFILLWMLQFYKNMIWVMTDLWNIYIGSCYISGFWHGLCAV